MVNNMTPTITPEALADRIAHMLDGEHSALDIATFVLAELHVAPAAAGVADGYRNGFHWSPEQFAQALERIAGGALAQYEGADQDEAFLRNAATLIRRMAAQPSAQPQAEPWGWSVVGTRHVFFGEHARDDAEREAKHCGGSARAFPLYAGAQPQAEQQDSEAEEQESAYFARWPVEEQAEQQGVDLEQEVAMVDLRATLVRISESQPGDNPAGLALDALALIDSKAVRS